MVMILGAGDIDCLFFCDLQNAGGERIRGHKRDCTDERAIGDERGVVGAMIR
ncbi:hypothetical protein BN2476_630033 [Paraburkholderia piptadeniae]|uniref:Uncharacterized protein n=1 Tax=Paraburkholderia piptadeniae TaxID=1701573 RepID=A0A1N7SL71_9BURK|nr:hypothetical protein BN2476_630033 [Paraburkholderia piptadeniae]